jgi:hypothetical protein
MSAMDDLVIGQTYGELTILGKFGKNTYGASTVCVRCSCGKEYDIVPSSITSRGYRRCASCNMAQRKRQRSFRPAITSRADRVHNRAEDVREALLSIKDALYR